MIQKFATLEQMHENGVVAVIRGASAAESYKSATACIEGGVTSIEVAFTAPHADQTIQQLREKYAKENKVIIGAGTVLDPSTARLAIIAGAQFIVASSFSRKVALTCNRYNIPYAPGCMSPREVEDAMAYGSDLVKIFPAAILGPQMIKEIHGPYPEANIMPSGGVNLENMKDWFASGAFVVGAGGSLVGPGAMGDYKQVKLNAQKFSSEFKRIMNK